MNLGGTASNHGGFLEEKNNDSSSLVGCPEMRHSWKRFITAGGNFKDITWQLESSNWECPPTDNTHTWRCTDPCRKTTVLLERGFVHFHVSWRERMFEYVQIPPEEKWVVLSLWHLVCQTDLKRVASKASPNRAFRVGHQDKA